jgi:hypothetical protein
MARGTVKTELPLVTAEDLRSRLAEYETRFGVPSDRLADAFRRDGELEETQEFRARGAVAHPPPWRSPRPYPEVDVTDVLSEIVKQLE